MGSWEARLAVAYSHLVELPLLERRNRAYNATRHPEKDLSGALYLECRKFCSRCSCEEYCTYCPSERQPEVFKLSSSVLGAGISLKYWGNKSG